MILARRESGEAGLQVASPTDINSSVDASASHAPPFKAGFPGGPERPQSPLPHRAGQPPPPPGVLLRRRHRDRRLARRDRAPLPRRRGDRLPASPRGGGHVAEGAAL